MRRTLFAAATALALFAPAAGNAEQQPAPQGAADKESWRPGPADFKAFTDARIAGLKAGLQLTPTRRNGGPPSSKPFAIWPRPAKTGWVRPVRRGPRARRRAAGPGARRSVYSPERSKASVVAPDDLRAWSSASSRGRWARGDPEAINPSAFAWIATAASPRIRSDTACAPQRGFQSRRPMVPGDYQVVSWGQARGSRSKDGRSRR